MLTKRSSRKNRFIAVRAQLQQQCRPAYPRHQQISPSEQIFHHPGKPEVIAREPPLQALCAYVRSLLTGSALFPELNHSEISWSIILGRVLAFSPLRSRPPIAICW